MNPAVVNEMGGAKKHYMRTPATKEILEVTKMEIHEEQRAPTQKDKARPTTLSWPTAKVNDRHK